MNIKKEVELIIKRFNLKLLSSVQIPEFIVNSVYLQEQVRRKFVALDIANQQMHRSFTYLSHDTKRVLFMRSYRTI